jgi:hypothetical protein
MLTIFNSGNDTTFAPFYLIVHNVGQKRNEVDPDHYFESGLKSQLHHQWRTVAKFLVPDWGQRAHALMLSQSLSANTGKMLYLSLSFFLFCGKVKSDFKLV